MTDTTARPLDRETLRAVIEVVEAEWMGAPSDGDRMLRRLRDMLCDAPALPPASAARPAGEPSADAPYRVEATGTHVTCTWDVVRDGVCEGTVSFFACYEGAEAKARACCDALNRLRAPAAPDGPTLTEEEQQRADAIAERWKAATPGPWHYVAPQLAGPSMEEYTWADVIVDPDNMDPASILDMPCEGDAQAIAAAPEDVAFLLDLVRRLSSGQPGGAGTPTTEGGEHGL